MYKIPRRIPDEEKDGAGDGIRTRDIDLGKVALYQLSYSRLCSGTYNVYPTALPLPEATDDIIVYDS
jgi:hypothetical protein